MALGRERSAGRERKGGREGEGDGEARRREKRFTITAKVTVKKGFMFTF